MAGKNQAGFFGGLPSVLISTYPAAIPMNSLRPAFFVVVISLLLFCQSAVRAEEVLQPGAKLDSLPVGPVTYKQVVCAHSMPAP